MPTPRAAPPLSLKGDEQVPNYDYTCRECGHTLELFQKITDAPALLCPLCKREGLMRGIGGGSATFHFKGSGFYITDYKKECPSPDSCACKSSD